MIPVPSFRRTKSLLFLVGLASLVISLPFILFYDHEKAKSMFYSSEVYRNIGQRLDPLLYTSETFRQVGWHLERGNVKFQFTNPGDMSGSPEEVCKKNNAIYAEELAKEISEPKDIDLSDLRAPTKEELPQYKRANATILALVRNSEVSGIRKTIRSLEQSFNSKYRYPYTFLNDQPFSQRFKDKMALLTDAPLNFVVIPPELWDKPEFIDEAKELQAMDIMEEHNVAYAKKTSYHNMCRFYLGNFFNVPELQQYKYYWRIEPSVKFFTDVQYDVFKYMERAKKIYGFTVSLYDIDETVASLWPETLNFLNQDDNYQYVNKDGAHQWLLENKQNPQKNDIAQGYSTCHFWSNFEIGDMDFFRSEAYTNWFNHLDSTGKFYYERWGDAPVHSVGLALFANKKDIHWFRDLGYEHDPYMNCPKSRLTSHCKPGKFSRWEHLADQNCMASWFRLLMGGEDTTYFE